MPDILAPFLVFFNTDHPIRSLVAGAFLVWLGMALFYLATRCRAASAALKVLGIAIALYGGAHASSAMMATGA